MMKITNLIFAFVLCVAGTSFSQSVWYSSGVNDPSGTASTDITIGVRDNTLGSEDTLRDSEETVIQSQQSNSFPTFYESYWLMSLDGLFGTHITDSSEIVSAALWFNAALGNGGSHTWAVQGLSVADEDWEHTASGARWGERSAGVAWSGGDISQSLTGDYGTVTLGGETEGEWSSIDLTAVFQDYADGLVGGIVITPIGQDEGPVYFGMNSSESASGIGFVVDQVPEPTTGLLALIGGCLAIGSRRIKIYESN